MPENLHFRSYDPDQTLLFPQRIDRDIPKDDPVRILKSVIESLDLSGFKKLYHERGRSPYHPKMMLMVIFYSYMNNVYSCRKIEKLLYRDIYYIWLSGYQKPDFATINRFRNRVKNEIGHIFTLLVLILVEKGFVTLEVEYLDGTKIESKANKYTFVWRKSVERNREKLLEKIRVLLQQINEQMAQDKAADVDTLELTPQTLCEISKEFKEALGSAPEAKTKEEKAVQRGKNKMFKELERHGEKLAEYNSRLEQMEGRNSISKTDPSATFMRMKEDAMCNGQTKPGYNLQISSENQFITDFALFPNPTDTLTFIPFLGSFPGRYGRFPKRVVADSGYGSEENYRFMDEAGIEGFVKYNRFHLEHRPRYKPDTFHPDSLYYNEEGDYYICPMGQRMSRTGTLQTRTEGGYISQSACYRAIRCKGCPLRCLCYKAKANQRTIRVNHQLNAYKRKACELLTSEEGIKERGRRCIEPEAVFGQMKSNMAYRRFRHMGKDKVVMDFTFFAIAFNIKKLCSMMRKVDKKGRKTSSYGKFVVIFICYMHKLEICQDKFEKNDGIIKFIAV
jgi:transposase